MSTPQKLRNALEIYFGPHDSEIKTEILDVLELHFGQRQDQQQIIREIVSAASPWVFSHDAQPEVGVEVICLDLNPLDGSVDVNTATRDEGSDWTDPECRFWWMHVPPLPETGEQTGQGQTRMDTGLSGEKEAGSGRGELLEEARGLANQIDGALVEIANGDRKPSQMPLAPLLRAVVILREAASQLENADLQKETS